jgi:hypothetical protein
MRTEISSLSRFRKEIIYLAPSFFLKVLDIFLFVFLLIKWNLDEWLRILQTLDNFIVENNPILSYNKVVNMRAVEKKNERKTSNQPRYPKVGQGKDRNAVDGSGPQNEEGR